MRISDGEIKRYQSQADVKRLFDVKKGVYLQFQKERVKASWFLRTFANGQDTWKKLGTWPDVSTKSLTQLLPQVKAKNVLGERVESVSEFDTCADMFSWYKVRHIPTLKDTESYNARSQLKNHLSRLNDVHISLLDHQYIDDRVIKNMQLGGYADGTIRAVFYRLKTIFRTALKARKIESSPLAGLSFSDFIENRIQAKECALYQEDLPEISQCLQTTLPRARMLTLLMMAHGTRISETRKITWRQVRGNELFIPGKDTKTGEPLRLPLTKFMRSQLDAYRAQQKSSPFLFPGQNGPISKSTASDWIAATRQETYWSAHDLRKLARSTWQDLGIDFMIGELLLNHKLSGVREAYIQTYSTEQKHKALTRWHEALQSFGIFFTPNHKTETIPRPAFFKNKPQPNHNKASGSQTGYYSEK